MRHEVIISYTEEDGHMTGMKNEGELVRCGNCVNCYADKIFGGMYCNGKRVSPVNYCCWGRRKNG